MHRRSIFAAALTAVTVLALGAPAAANTLTIDQTTVNGSTATVSGTVAFPAITAPQDVGGIKTPFTAATAPAGQAAGLDLANATIQPISGGLRFTWNVLGMPEQGMLPEGVRFTWSFSIGTRLYQLQAKRTNMASVTTTEDPVGHAQKLASQAHWFQLRGACQGNYQGAPISGCFHLAFLEGGVDAAAKKVWMDLPYETRDSIGRIVAPDFKPGVELVANRQANASIAASFQAVATYNDAPAGGIPGFMANYINDWSTYFVGGRVQLGVASHLADPAEISYGAPVSLNGGAFSSTVTGLSASANSVFVRACNGASCTYASRRLIGV